ncbi:hypothetical protein HELRODRAFT_114551 [Helobdella robusta]|uniref:WD repeat-containing protein 7 n=1 Tax=Helobdella robusta TaxID=6412 RepID=T1EG27_HELRO|nr:hypothetical protein HELRODRAFT_114551 [Helobdella robusta]ESN95959.1 hypothetical protein HELRODRAFT_114551 [Helobdella robusta]
MLGVVGAEFGANLGNGGSGGGGYGGSSGRESQQAVADGFSVVNHEHARNTSKALAYLLFQQPTNQTKYSLIRRASVDLIGRGFVVWQPYLDVSNVLIGLLELCIDADRLVPSMTFGLPLTPRADACRTARHALSLIATARPSTYVITMAKEVARYNAMIQNAQSQTYQHSLHAYVLVKSKPEILRVLQQLVEKMAVELMELLSELTDVMIHCLDMNQIKTSGLQEIFPGYCKKFPMVSYCHSTRRIVVGTRNGNLLFYDLKQGKCQSIAAHRGQILGVGFSADGKFLASIALADMKVYIWQVGDDCDDDGDDDDGDMDFD